MPLIHTQLGRFGSFGMGLRNHIYDDPDQQIAHLYADNGMIQYSSIPGARPTVQDVLDSKGIWDQGSSMWTGWSGQFDAIKTPFGLPQLHAQCTTLQPGASNQCWHALIPPLKHYNLKSFVQGVQGAQSVLSTLPDNVAQRIGANTFFIYTDSQPLWNFIITEEGEILLSEEDYGVIKHSSLSGGREVWSAGQVGILNNKIRLVDLRSGHFMRQILHPSSLS